MSIELTSPAFKDGGTIPDRYGRLGGNASPPLEWSGVPAGTLELALQVEDPDAPSGTFTHWVLAGLDPELERLDEGDVPSSAVEGSNDFGEDGYSGPQPPTGDPPHRYVFTLLALGVSSELPPGASPAEFHDAVQGSELGRGQLVGLYGR
jgi:Raf kinase inhibitor-like YbhB/YbcL family protein